MPATTITITDTNAHKLYDVLTGKDVTGVSVGHSTASGIPSNLVRALSYQADSTNAGTVSHGDASLSSSDTGAKLAASGTMGWGPMDHPRIDLSNKFIIASAATQKLNVNWEY